MTQTTTNKHLASIIHAEPVKLRTGQWGISVTHSDGGGHQEVVGFGDAAERASRGQCIDLMARACSQCAQADLNYHPNLDGPAEPYALSIDGNGNPIAPDAARAARIESALLSHLCA